MITRFTGFLGEALAPYSEEAITSGKNSWHSVATTDGDVDPWGASSIMGVTLYEGPMIAGNLPRLSFDHNGKPSGKLQRIVRAEHGILWLSALEKADTEDKSQLADEWQRLVDTYELYGAQSLNDIFPMKEYTSARRSVSITVNSLFWKLLEQVEGPLVCHRGHIYALCDTDAVIVKMTTAELMNGKTA